MSDLQCWENLPSGMDQDFVSYKKDYDFPYYLSEKEEWIHLKRKDKITISEPFLIMELNRFVPYLEGNDIKFHPLNMPYVKIGKIDIVGFVMHIDKDEKFIEIEVDDGTGTITIFYQRDQWEAWRKKINLKHFKSQDCATNFHNTQTKLNYPINANRSDTVISKHKLLRRTNKEMMPIKQKDYVQATGYCMLDFMFGTKPQDEISFEHLCRSRLNFFATRIITLSEQDYNTKIFSWLTTIVRRRYDEQLNKINSVPENK